MEIYCYGILYPPDINNIGAFNYEYEFISQSKRPNKVSGGQHRLVRSGRLPVSDSAKSVSLSAAGTTLSASLPAMSASLSNPGARSNRTHWANWADWRDRPAGANGISGTRWPERSHRSYWGHGCYRRCRLRWNS